jgi:cob(I)alamin adenosyltransferase
MKIYTKTGDKGKTSSYDGKILPKEAIIFQIIGEIDELSSRIGMACSHCTQYLIQKQLRTIQSVLQNINTNIATIDKHKKTIPEIQITLVEHLEKQIDSMEKNNSPLTKFILPGVTVLDSFLHSCRTQTRKCERLICQLNSEQSLLQDSSGDHNVLGNMAVDSNILKYINRLSDFFFVMARYVCKNSNEPDCFLDEFMSK